MSTLNDFPAQILTVTIWVYWLCVGAMILRVRRHTRKSRALRVLFPKDTLERYMWVIWVPLVVCWNLFPYLALKQAHPLLAVPDFAHAIGFYAVVRWIAAVCAVLLLGLTVDCWLRMGKNWRMGVSLDQTTELVTTGLFRHIRHPIYALSIVLMLCSLMIIPTLPMLVIAVLHVMLMIVKARNEEHHLRITHGAAYAAYEADTGRFFPRLTSRRP